MVAESECNKVKMPRLWAVVSALVIVGCSTTLAVAQPPDGELNQLRQARLEQTKDLIDSMSIRLAEGSGEELQRTEHAILRYTNPVTSSFTEGTLFLWLHGKRPMAAISISFRDTGEVWWELSSLCDQPLTLTREGVEVWQPARAGRPSELFPGAPAVAETSAARLAQMRSLARRFQVREERRQQWQDARFLSQPLHRWEATADGVVDGALFGFSETTDPEVMLILEARRDKTNQARWYFCFAKMTSAPVAVSLDKSPIWNVPAYWKNPRTPADSYREALLVPAR